MQIAKFISIEVYLLKSYFIVFVKDVFFVRSSNIELTFSRSLKLTI